MTTLLIDKDDAQKILDYLSNRPYREVFDIIPALVNLKPLSEQKPEHNED